MKSPHIYEGESVNLYSLELEERGKKVLLVKLVYSNFVLYIHIRDFLDFSPTLCLSHLTCTLISL